MRNTDKRMDSLILKGTVHLSNVIQVESGGSHHSHGGFVTFGTGIRPLQLLRNVFILVIRESGTCKGCNTKSREIRYR